MSVWAQAEVRGNAGSSAEGVTPVGHGSVRRWPSAGLAMSPTQRGREHLPPSFASMNQ